MYKWVPKKGETCWIVEKGIKFPLIYCGCNGCKRLLNEGALIPMGAIPELDKLEKITFTEKELKEIALEKERLQEPVQGNGAPDTESA